MNPLIIAFLFVAAEASAICKDWKGSAVGNLDLRRISEASGLTSSKKRPGNYFWINDSGNSAEIHATQENGTAVKTVSLNGFSNSDFEAMASGPCPRSTSETCIYVGDIGDGIGWRSTFKIGIFSEADFWNSSKISPQATVSFSYPDGGHNAEALIVTGKGEMIVFTKEDDGTSEIYSVDLAGKIKKVSSLDLNGIVSEDRQGNAPKVTDAALSPDGTSVLLLTYTDILSIPLQKILSPARVLPEEMVIINGPDFSQQETLTFTSADRFLVATESEDGTAAGIHAYQCASR